VTVIMVALGAAVGAPARYLVDRWVQSWHRTVFPWGTLAVNVVASLVLGAVVAAAGELGPQVMALVATGFCGALSTYSTFGYETLRLMQEHVAVYALVNVLLSLAASIAAAALGWSVMATVL
jgi:CrcB protein